MLRSLELQGNPRYREEQVVVQLTAAGQGRYGHPPKPTHEKTPAVPRETAGAGVLHCSGVRMSVAK